MARKSIFFVVLLPLGLCFAGENSSSSGDCLYPVKTFFDFEVLPHPSQIVLTEEERKIFSPLLYIEERFQKYPHLTSPKKREELRELRFELLLALSDATQKRDIFNLFQEESKSKGFKKGKFFGILIETLREARQERLKNYSESHHDLSERCPEAVIKVARGNKRTDRLGFDLSIYSQKELSEEAFFILKSIEEEKTIEAFEIKKVEDHRKLKKQLRDLKDKKTSKLLEESTKGVLQKVREQLKKGKGPRVRSLSSSCLLGVLVKGVSEPLEPLSFVEIPRGTPAPSLASTSANGSVSSSVRQTPFIPEVSPIFSSGYASEASPYLAVHEKDVSVSDKRILPRKRSHTLPSSGFFVTISFLQTGKFTRITTV